MEEMKTGVFTYKDESYNFNFNTSLSAYDKMIFVRTVVNNLIEKNNYDVIIRDLIFDFAIIEMFTNIDTSFIDMEDDDGEKINPIIIIEHFLKETSVVDIVKANMELGLIDELNHAVDLNIQYITGIHSNPLGEAVANLINTIEKKVNEFDMGDAMDMVQKFTGMTGELTPESIVDAFINSDAHKKNLMDIEDFKSKEK